MSKKFYILTIIITLFIAAIIVAFFIYYNGGLQQQETSEIPETTGENYALLPIEELAKKTKLEIHTEKGTVDIGNVYKNPVEKLSNNGVSFADNSDYYIAYYPEKDDFLVVIKNKDVISAEKKAEDDFIKQLGITEEQACELNVLVTVPFDVNEKYSGGLYGFSFCSNVNHIN